MRIVLAVLTALMAPLGAQAQELWLGEKTTPLVGWVDFCKRHRSECDVPHTMPRVVELTKEKLQELQRVNRVINRRIRPKSDMDHWGVFEKWSYPDDGYGDCEDYVLLKRRILMGYGWPREALLITVVHDKDGSGHAVLMVRTDKGDLISDNQTEDILLWHDTPYQYVKAQAPYHANTWLKIEVSGRQVATAKTGAR